MSDNLDRPDESGAYLTLAEVDACPDGTTFGKHHMRRAAEEIERLRAENAEMHRVWESTGQSSYNDWRYHNAGACTDRLCWYCPAESAPLEGNE